MKEKLNKRTIICSLALVIIALLLCNTNNNPNTFLVRIIPPYQKGNTTVFISSIVILIVIPFILFDLYKGTEWRFLDSVPKRLLWTIIFLLACAKISESGVQLIKSFQTDLDAIYLDREHMGMQYNWHTIEEEGKVYTVYDGEAYITLKNCSRKKEQQFRVKLNVDDSQRQAMDPIIKETISESEEFTLQPGEIRRITVCSFDGLKSNTNEKELGRGGGKWYSIDEVILHNDEMSVNFIKEY